MRVKKFRHARWVIRFLEQGIISLQRRERFLRRAKEKTRPPALTGRKHKLVAHQLQRATSYPQWEARLCWLDNIRLLER